MELVIERGFEHRFVISRDIYNADAFMYSAYKQARFALTEIIRHADKFNTDDLCNELYGYSQNIIAFDGKRGQGKTSTMVSFSKAMQEGTLKEDPLKGCSFKVLRPIDPTIMESDQNILELILSRMYRLAEEKWCGSCSNNRFSGCGPSEAQKNELLKGFQGCLSGINAVKSRSGKKIESLTDISIMSDSSVLKRNLYCLTNKLLEFVMDDYKKGKSFLVILLDDTDTQITKAYEILEDIRKFFSIPNVVILMAADMKMLRTVVLQHFVKEFKDGLDRDIVKTSELAKTESKYIDKMIPPTHTIHLPKLEDNIKQYADKLKLSFNADSEVNILFEYDTSKGEGLLQAQELILRYIYRKTNIVFVAPENDYHKIVPTTLRGMVQLLALLDSMENVPEIENFNDQTEFINSLGKRIEILEANLPRFENYFLNEWVSAKLPHDKAKAISDLASITQENKFSYIVNYLKTNYDDLYFEISSESQSEKITDYKQLDDYINRISKKNGTSEDLMFFFAIRTCFTIMYNKAAMQQMRRTFDEYTDGLLVFDFSPEVIHMPDIQVPDELYGNPDFTSTFDLSNDKLNRDSLNQFVFNCLVKPHANSGKCFGYTHFVTLALSLGHKDILKTINDDMSQKWIFESQMAALRMTSNHELNNYIFEKMNNAGKKNIRRNNYMDIIQAVYSDIDEISSKVNNKNSVAPNMLQNRMRGFIDCVSPNGHVIGAVKEVFDAIMACLGTRRSKTFIGLLNIYKKSQSFKKSLKGKSIAPGNLDSTQLSMELNALADECNSFSARAFGKANTLVVIEEDFIKRVLAGEIKYASFAKQFNERFKKLCINCDEDFALICADAKGAK